MEIDASSQAGFTRPPGAAAEGGDRAGTTPPDRVELALRGLLAQRELNAEEAAQLDTALRSRIDAAVADADFTHVPVPDFAAVLPDLAALGSSLEDLGAHSPVAARLLEELRAATLDR